MPDKHFCQGPRCHEKTTQDRFLKSRGVVRGRYALFNREQADMYCKRGKYFCSTRCESEWLDEHMLAVEMRIPVPFITWRRESKGYAKVTEETNWGRSYTHIRKVDNRTEIE